jgi:hypothetical protein
MLRSAVIRGQLHAPALALADVLGSVRFAARYYQASLGRSQSGLD